MRRRYTDLEVEQRVVPALVRAVYPVLIPLEQQDCATQKANHERVTELCTKMWRDFCKVES